MKIEFKASYASVLDMPFTQNREIAFCGKSNVGKSSLVNLLAKSKIAHVSKLPGRTQLINLFSVENIGNLIDLPGYGYAKVPRSKIESLSDLIHNYIVERKQLVRLFLLIDSRLLIQKNDSEFMNFLDYYGIAYQIILTKIDKIKKSELESAILSIKNEAQLHPAMLEEVITISSTKKLGIKMLESTIFKTLKS